MSWHKLSLPNLTDTSYFQLNSNGYTVYQDCTLLDFNDNEFEGTCIYTSNYAEFYFFIIDGATITRIKNANNFKVKFRAWNTTYPITEELVSADANGGDNGYFDESATICERVLTDKSGYYYDIEVSNPDSQFLSQEGRINIDIYINKTERFVLGSFEFWVDDDIEDDGGDSGGGGESAPVAKERYEFAYTGHEESVTLPKGTYRITAYGGNGGSATSNNVTVDGGKGGKAEATITLEEDTTLYISVGGNGVDGSDTSASAGGWNGGGSGASYNTRYFGGGGGGATHIALASGLLSSLENNKESIIIVAGGGGASGVARRSTTDASFAKAIGGNASALNGESGTGTATTQCGGGGTQTAGGAKASASSSSTAGTFGQGGAGTYACGGGGYYGGGGGRTYCSGSSATRYAGGGGAGSGYFATTLADTNYEVSTESEGMVIIVDMTKYPNKIEIEGEVILDLTKSTVTAESILAGFKAFKSNGRLIEGLANAGKEYETGEFVIASTYSEKPRKEIRFSKTHDVPPSLIYCLNSSDWRNDYVTDGFTFFCIPFSANSYYGIATTALRSSLFYSTQTLLYPFGAGDSNGNYADYYATNSAFYYPEVSGYYFNKGVFKWIAIWL